MSRLALLVTLLGMQVLMHVPSCLETKAHEGSNSYTPLPQVFCTGVNGKASSATPAPSPKKSLETLKAKAEATVLSASAMVKELEKALDGKGSIA